MRTLLTIATDTGQWAPPKMVELVVTTHAPSGLGITNAHEVSWTLAQKAEIVAAAVAVGTGNWHRVTVGSILVRKGQDAMLAANSLVIDVNLPVMSPEEIHSQGLLEGRLREIPPGRLREILPGR